MIGVLRKQSRTCLLFMHLYVLYAFLGILQKISTNSNANNKFIIKKSVVI